MSSAAQGRHGGEQGGALYLDFLTGVGGQRPWGPEESLMGGGDGAGLHSLQESVGCNIDEDSHPRGFRLLYFNGELLLSCYPEPHGCTLPQSSARTLAMEMELSKHYQAHVQRELCWRLRSYLESWTGFTERTGTDAGPGPSSAPALKTSHPDLPTETLRVLWARMCSVGAVSWGFFPVLLNPL